MDAPRRVAAIPQRYFILLWLCLAAAISYACRNGLGVAESTIREKLELSKEEMGLVMALFFAPYAIGQIPGGWLADRIGGRMTMTLCALGWSCSTIAMGLATNLWLLAIPYFANGLFQAGLFPSCTKTFAQWFPGNRRAVASGWLASSMSLGSAAASATAAVLIGQIGWRWTFALFGAAGIAWAAGFLRSFRDRPEDHPGVTPEELTVIRHVPVSTAARPQPETVNYTDDRNVWLALLLSPATWLICGQQFCRAGGQIFFSTWFPTYLQEQHQVSVATSGILNSLPLSAIVVGALAGGFVSDAVLTWTGSRRLARQGVASLCMIICAGFVFFSRTIDQPVAAVLVMSAGMLFAAIGGPTAYAITIDMGGGHTAKLFGCMNMLGNFGATVVSLGVPWFLRQVSGNWDYVLLGFGILWLGAGLCWLALNPNGNIFQQSLWGRQMK